MELRQLRYFVAVAEEGNISRAAQKIFLTQPALSRQIKALEDELGQDLLDRRAHSIGLTPAGELLWQEGRALLQHADEVLARVRANGREVRLRVGYAPSLTAGLLATAVENFTQAHPHAKVELFDSSTTEMVEGLKAGRLDVVLAVQQSCGREAIEWTPLCDSAWALAVSRKHAFAGSKRVGAAQIAAEPLLVFQRSEYPDYYEFVTGWFRRQKLTPRITGEFDGGASLLAAVEAGLGVALVSDRAVASSRVVLIPLTNAPDPIVIAAGWRAGRKLEKPVQVFLAELRTAAEAG